MRIRLLCCLAAVSLGCGPAVEESIAAETDASSTSTSTSTPPSTSASSVTSAATSADPSTSGPPAGSSSSGDHTTTGIDTSADDWAQFDLPTDSICDPWQQDCPRGEKCVPVADDGGNTWNTYACVPVVPNPASPGEACSFEGDRLGGYDDCELGSICWDVGEDGVGECTPQCTGSPVDPMCPAQSSCTISGDSVVNICLPWCDPLAQDCDSDETCLLVNDDVFFCVTQAGEGGAGDPCEFINVCLPGLTCGPAETVDGCEGTGCCTAWCDIENPTTCEPGQACITLWPKGTPPPGQEDYGICTAT